VVTINGAVCTTTMSLPTILNLTRLPARLDTGQTAEFLGLQQHDIATLIAARLLKPIGNPQPNGPKFFAAVEIEDLARDRDWLNRAQLAIQRHWQMKNHGGSGGLQASEGQSGHRDSRRHHPHARSAVDLDVKQSGNP